MYELNQVGEHSFYIQSPAKIGVYLTDHENVVLIDSGSDKDAGKKVKQILDNNGWHLKAIYNTHSHADHIGGNHYLQGQTNCKIYAPGIECDFTCHPVLETAFLFGAFPPEDICHKFLRAQESSADLLSDEVLPQGMEQIPLPGHFFDMVGFRTRDDAVYLADCLSGRETLEKYRIVFLYDVKSYLSTLEKVKQMKAAVFIPAHAEAVSDIVPLAQFNIDKVMETADDIAEICREPLCFEDILQRLFQRYALVMNFAQYAMVGSTVRSYLSWMKWEGRIKTEFTDCKLLWRT